MKKGQQPIRMCCLCKKRYVKKELTRYVFPKYENENGKALALDLTKTMEGRGYYICMSPECQQKFNKNYFERRKRKGV